MASDKGTCTLVFRNASNGFYGGDLQHTAEHPPEDSDWINVTDNWSADD